MSETSITELCDVSAILDQRVLDAMGESEAKIMDHLLFHKAIVKEPHEREIDMDNYLKIMRELDMGIHVVLDNPVDRAVAIAFQLVIDEKFDPWNIDLAEFTKLYLAKLRKEEDVNFIIAGRLVVMAWSILRSQSARILDKADCVDEPQETFFGDWEVEPVLDSAPGSEFSDFVLGSDGPMITEAVHARDVRPVTLMTLLEAFDEAREEMALKDRVKRMAKHDDGKPIVIQDKLHGESLQEDISMTWQRICDCQGDRIPISRVWDGSDTLDKVTVFISTLFLAKMEKVQLEQRRFPHGEIFISNIESREMVQAEGMIPIPMTSTEELAVV